VGTLFLSLQRAGRESTAEKEGKIKKIKRKERKKGFGKSFYGLCHAHHYISLMIGHSRFPHFPNSISYLLSIMVHLFTVTYHFICTSTWVKKKKILKKKILLFTLRTALPLVKSGESFVCAQNRHLCFIDTGAPYL